MTVCRFRAAVLTSCTCVKLPHLSCQEEGCDAGKLGVQPICLQAAKGSQRSEESAA
jgi:hypothetical protein